jgi:hypothetical protein
MPIPAIAASRAASVALRAMEMVRQSAPPVSLTGWTTSTGAGAA